MPCRLLFVLLPAVLCCLKMPEQSQRKPREKVQVNLPPKPNLAAPQLPRQYPDGALTVEGFFKKAKEVLAQSEANRDVTVRGYIFDIVSCPPTSRVCPTVPHIVLSDSLTNPRKKLVVVSDPPEAILELFPKGSQQTIRGTMAQWTPDGRLIDLNGLLVVRDLPTEANAASSPQPSSP